MIGAGQIIEADSIEDVASPQLCKNLIGHHDVWQLLLNQLGQNRLPSGMLIHGPKGIGKASLAYCLAREVLSQTGDEDSSRVAEQVYAGAHPNLYILRRVARERGVGYYNEIRVDEVRAILRKLHQTRGRAGHRLLIVDAVDDCNVNAANALLKTLEEPPADTHIILVSHRPGRLLPTIRSRCQAHSMRVLATDDVQKIMLMADVSPDQAAPASALAGGRPRRGFEALHMGTNQILGDLKDWLEAPSFRDMNLTIKIAEFFADKKNITELSFAREMILDWIAKDVRAAAVCVPRPASYLASANQLWEKANQMFSQTDSYNLDAKLSLMVLFDEIERHRQNNA